MAVGNGSYRRRSNGSYEYRFSYQDEYGRVCKKSYTSKDLDECINKANDFIEKQEQKNKGIDTEATIPEIMKARYQADFDKNYVGEQGYCRNLANLKIIERHIIGQIPIAEITVSHLDYFLRSITRYSSSVIGKVYVQLRTAYKIAMEKEIICVNLMEHRELRCPKSDKRTKKVRGFTQREQDIFVQCIKNHKVPNGRNNYKLQILIELFSGMRMGEINALQANNIDFEQGVIHVNRTISRGIEYREFVKDGTKTYAGIRDVPISKLLEPVLREALSAQEENPLDLLFYDSYKDDVIATHQVNAFFRRICEKCGLPYNGQHALRHTFATRCIEAGIPAIVLKRWLGHTDIHITLDTYADVFDSMNNDAMNKLDEHMKDYADHLNEMCKVV